MSPVPRHNPDRDKMARRAMRLARKGVPVPEIAQRLGVALSTVHRYLVDPSGEITRVSAREFKRREKLGLTQKQDETIRKRRERVRQAHDLHKQGHAIEDIAQQLGVSVKTISNYIHDPDNTRKHRRQRYQRTGVYSTRQEAELALNRIDLPISTKITMRPVWKRRQRRIYSQNGLPPPNEDERRDAIKILGDKRLQKYAPALYFEAFLIMDEAGQ